MTETLQIILIIMLMIVIVFFIILGIQVFFLLRDVRKTISKANDVLDTTSSITDSISEPLAALSGVAGTLGTGAIAMKALRVAIKLISNTDAKKNKEDDDE